MRNSDELGICTVSNTVERTTLTTGLPYPELVQAFERELGHWDPETARQLVSEKALWSDVETAVLRAAGPQGLMIICKADQGAVTSLSGSVKQCCLYLVGNPVIANWILDIDPRACYYVPFRVCLYDAVGPGGAAISYERPSSFLGSLNKDLAEIGKMLDSKIDAAAYSLAGWPAA